MFHYSTLRKWTFSIIFLQYKSNQRYLIKIHERIQGILIPRWWDFYLRKLRKHFSICEEETRSLLDYVKPCWLEVWQLWMFHLLKAAGTLESDCWNVGGRERLVVIIKMSIILRAHLSQPTGSFGNNVLWPDISSRRSSGARDILINIELTQARLSLNVPGWLEKFLKQSQPDWWQLFSHKWGKKYLIFFWCVIDKIEKLAERWTMFRKINQTFRKVKIW